MAAITFVYPDFESLGVELLMAVCREAGHVVRLVYYEAEDAYIGRKTKCSYDRVAARVCETQPDLVAFSCVTDNYLHQLHCARAVKARDSRILTLFGGVHPTAVPERVLREEAVDAVAVGEAERSLENLLRLSAGHLGFTFPDEAVRGIAFRKGGRVVGNWDEGELADLDALPYPYKEPFLQHLPDARQEYRIASSRGCPFRCSYCFNSHLHKLRTQARVRRRSVSDVIAELVLARERFNPKYVIFLDDAFTSQRAWVRDFCQRYSQQVMLPFACITNPAFIDEDLPEVLAAAGCVNVQLGVQSLSEPLCRTVLDRPADNDRVEKAIVRLNACGIRVQVDHMLGIPGDSLELQEQALLFYNEHRPSLISVFWLTYYPKTTILETARAAGHIDAEDIDRIEAGERLTDESYLTGGSMKNPREYYAVSFLLNWLPLLPRWFVRLCVRSGLYRLARLRCYYLSTALPRALQALLDRRDFRGRSHILRFLKKKRTDA